MSALQTVAFLVVGALYFILIYKVARRRLQSESNSLAGNWLIFFGSFIAYTAALYGIEVVAAKKGLDLPEWLGLMVILTFLPVPFAIIAALVSDQPNEPQDHDKL